MTGVLTSLEGDAKGDYLPLRGSQSYASKAGGMSPHQEEALRRACALFTEPDSRLRLSAGFGRHWPDARGVFVNDAQSCFVWCNEEDHVRVFSRQHNVDLKAMWVRIEKTVNSLEQGIAASGRKWMRSDRLGFISTCPSRLGTGLKASVSLKIPLLSASVDLPALCRSMQLQSSQEVGSVTYGSVWNVTNIDCLGETEVDILNSVIQGSQALVMMEQRLENGEPIYDAIPGMGSDPFPGFPSDRCPPRLPSLSRHCSITAAVLKENVDIYGKLRSRQTSKGLGLAACIKPCMDEHGKPNSLDVGLVACDEECFSTFSELFDPVIQRLHTGFSSAAKHPGDTNLSKLSNAQIDPTGAHAVSLRVELRRNLSGFRLSPCVQQDERRQAERIAVQALTGLGGDWSGDYMPLTWSESYEALPTGMPSETQAQLRDDGLLFAEPTSSAKLASGLGRQWPDARGVYLSKKRSLFAWCNEEDHICLVAKQDGADIKSAITALEQAAAAIEAEAWKAGSSFMKDDRLGFLTVNPLNLGNACTLAVLLRIPNLAKHAQFVDLCQAFDLKASWRAGAWDISTSPSLGVSQVDLVTGIIEGCALLVTLEQKLAKGLSIAEELRTVGINI